MTYRRTFDLAIRPDAADIRRASEWLARVGHESGVPSEHLDRLDLCLNEALANVASHGELPSDFPLVGIEIEIEASPSGTFAQVTVSDHASAFDPLSAQTKPRPATLDDAEPGGLGLTMIRQFSDSQRYAHADGQNRLSFSVFWNKAGMPSPIVRTPFRRRGEGSIGSEGAPHESRKGGLERRREGGLLRHSLFRDVPSATIDATLADCEVLALAAGTELLRPGQPNDRVYLLLSGRLTVKIGDMDEGGKLIAMGPGETIGEMSAIDGKPVSAAVTALTAVRLLEISPDVFWNQVMALPGVARNLMATLVDRMRGAEASMLESLRKRLELEHLRHELDVARQIQLGMLPLVRPMFPDRPEVDVAAIMEPTSAVGGDLFDAFFVNRDCLFLCVGDVSGHGTPAALFMARTLSLLRMAAATHVAQPHRLVAAVNDQLCNGNEPGPLVMFVTLFCAYLDVSSGRLVYSNAGHLAPFVLRGKAVEALPMPEGVMAGAIPGIEYSSMETMLEAGDALICYTDGLTEAECKDGEQFSEERLGAVVASNPTATMERLLALVRERVVDFTGRPTLDDDCTLLAVRRI